MTSSGPDQLGHQLAMHLRAAHAHLRRRSNLVFASFGMSADQYVLLRVLSDISEATQQDLVRRCYSDTATIGTMLFLLESKGLVARTPHPHDGRAIHVRLTPAGRRLTKKMTECSSGIRAELVALFNKSELQVLMDFLQRLSGAMRPPVRRRASLQGSQAPRRVTLRH